MEDFCDFHPKFLGEERDDLTYRGRFATFPASDAPGPSGTANTGRTSATWFYRYNSREIEVRNIRTCKEGVLARFKAADLAQTTGEERITFVTHARLAAAEYLIICTTNSSSSRLWLWDLFTFRAQLVLSSDRGSFSTATVTTAMDGPEGLRAYYVLGATGSHVHYAELLLDESGGSELQPNSTWTMTVDSNISAMTSYKPSSNTAFLLFVGTNRNQVHVYELDGQNERLLGTIDTANVSPSQLWFDERIEGLRPNGVLFAACNGGDAQSTPELLCWNVSTQQEVTVNAAGRYSVEQEGYIAALTVERVGSGHKLYLGLRLHADMQHSNLIHELSTLNGDISVVDTRDVTATNSSPILDLHSELAVSRCHVLYLNKLASIVPAMIVPEAIGRSNERKDRSWFTVASPEEYRVRAQHIVRNRQMLGGKLFFDVLLEATLQSGTLYPPRNEMELNHLLDVIDQNESSSTRSCLVLYLLMEYEDGKAESFASDAMINDSYFSAIRGYWCMDHLQFEEGVHHLTQPSVVHDWPHTVLRILHSHQRWLEAARFLEIVRPNTETHDKEDIKRQMDVLLRTNIPGAVHFMRSYASPQKEHLLDQFLKYHLLDNSKEAFAALASMDFQDWEEAHIIRKCEKSQQQSAKIFLMTYLMNRGRYVPLMSLYETPGIQQTAALNAVVQNIRLIMPGVHRVAHEVAIEEPSQSDTEVTVDAGGDVPVEKPLAPFSASTAIRGDASTPTNAQKNMIKALRRHEERKEKISPVNQPVMSWAAPVERSPVAEEVRSPAPPQRAAPATPVGTVSPLQHISSSPFVAPPRTSPKSPNGYLPTKPTPPSQERPTAQSPVYKSPPTPYAALPESYRPSPLRNPILLIHQEIASPEPATTTPIRPYNPVSPATISSLHASPLSATPRSPQRNGELTPHSDQRSGQSTPRSVQSDRVLQIIKSPVSSSSPPTAPLKNMSPFAPPPEPPVEQSIVEAEAFKTPAKRHARRTVLATPSRSARPQTRRRNQEEMEIDESVEDTGATDAMDVEVEQASATPMKTPARRSTRVAAAISRTEPRALRKTPARRAHADHEETAGADENEGTSQMEVEPVKPITGRKTAGRRGKAGQLADEEQELPSTPSRKPRQPPKSKSTKKAPAATPARVTRTSSRESTPALDDPMTLDDLATPGKTPAARGGRRKAAAATPAAATPSSARPVTRALARQLGGN